MTKIKAILLAAAMVCATGMAATAHAALAIIAHPTNPASGITADDAERIFLGKTGEMGNGRRVSPVDQSVGSGSRAKFLQKVLHKSEDELALYWSKLQFTGKGQPPRDLGDDAAVKAFVAGNPDAIGYVDGKFVDGSVKVLLIIP